MKQPTLFSAALVTLAIFTGCSTDSIPQGDPADPGNGSVIDPVVPKTSSNAVTVPVVDAVTGEPLDGNLRVINGSGIVSKRLKADANIPVVNGVAFVELRDDLSFPLSLSINVEVTGYVETALTLTFDSPNDFPSDGELALDALKLVSTAPNAAPAGVVVGQREVALSQASQPVDLETDVPDSQPGTDLDEGKVTVTIPPDATPQDAQGQPVDVSSGSVKVTTTVFTIADNASLSTFPGGLNQAVINNAQQIPSSLAAASGMNTSAGENRVTFESAGFTAIKMTAPDGTSITRFVNPITVRFKVAKDVTNPDTGSKIKPGDSIPVWSFDESTGVWKYESNATVREDSSTGEYFVNQSVNHLTYFNLDYMRGESQRCRLSSMTVKDANGNPYGGTLFANIRAPSRGFAARSNSGSASALSLANVPRSDGARGIRYNIEVFDGKTSEKLTVTGFNGSGAVSNGNLANVDICGSDGATISLAGVKPAEVAVSVQVNTFCSNDSANPRTTPLAGVRTYVFAATTEVVKTDVNGQATLATVANRNGTVYAMNPITNRYERQNFQAPASGTVSLSFNFGQTCKLVTGTQGSGG